MGWLDHRVVLIVWENSVCFPSGWTNLISHQQCTKFPFPAHPHQHLTILTGVRRYLNVAFIHNSMMIGNFHCIFMYLLSVCLHSLEKCLSKSSSQLLKIFCYWVVWVSYIFGILTSCLIYDMQIFFFFAI